MQNRRGAHSALAIVIVALATTGAWGGEGPATSAGVYEMEVMGVQADPQSGTPMVFLRGKVDKRELAMYIGPFEAQAIALPLQGIRPPRPYTHDLMLDALHRLDARVKRIVVTALRENTYFATVVLDVRGQEISVDSRPSDAIALALREEAPILAAEAAFVRPSRSGTPESGERGTP